MKTISDAVAHALNPDRANVEPVPRMMGGVGPRYVRHRFDIKGGISPVDALAAYVMKPNSLLERLNKR